MPDVQIYALDESATIDEGIADGLSAVYENLIVQLYPYGPAWEFGSTEPHRSVVAALAREPYRVERRGAELLAEFPGTLQELLPEWENSLGLFPAGQTIEQRNAAVVSKLQGIGAGAGNEPFFIATSVTYGADDAQIRRDYNPFLCTSVCTHGLNGRAGGWLYTWTVIIEGLTPPQAALEAFIRSYAQAHEIVHFEYE